MRRSARESRPSALKVGEEWAVEETSPRSPHSKRRPVSNPPSPTKSVSPMKSAEMSPGRVGRRSRERRGRGALSEEEQETPLTSSTGRVTRRTPQANGDEAMGEERSTKSKERSPRREPKRSLRGRQARETDDSEVEDSPFYPAPQHVRFSPSVKTKSGHSSPFGRKTRSGKRGLSSYIQSLPSEDEQSAFNKQYSRDLRRRQQRRASEEDKEQGEARRSSRKKGRAMVESESGGEELSLGARKRNLRASRKEEQQEEEEEEEEEDEEDEEGAGDPTVTEAIVKRSSRRRLRSEGGEEADTEEHDQEAETPEVRRSSRRRAVVASSTEEDEEEEEEEDETPQQRKKITMKKRKSEVEELKGSGSEEEEEEEEQEQGRRLSSRSKMPPNRLTYKPAGESDSESESEEEAPRKVKEGRKKVSPKKKYGLRGKRDGIRRYTDEFPGRSKETEGRNQGWGKRSGGGGRSKDSRGRGGGKKRTRTGDSSSPTESSESDEANFEMRKSKRMTLEREKMRPMNMDKREVNKSIFKDRSNAGASLADVQPMEMDMGVTFESVGGLKEHVNALKEMVMFPLLYPELFQQFSIQPPRGVLFYGPPGTGKTLLARALACECSTENRKVAFFMRKGADCLSKWIGESERQLRLLFDQAYQMRPSIIFFDEIDGLAPVRSSRQDQIHSSIVSTLLALMDGLDSRGEVVLIGATNRLENIDPTLRRPGRFDRELRFALPDRKTRKEIIQLHTKAWAPPIAPPLLNTLATKTIGYCGADLKGLTAEAALNALRRRYPQVTNRWVTSTLLLKMFSMRAAFFIIFCL